jgi:hypothetical protein
MSAESKKLESDQLGSLEHEIAELQSKLDSLGLSEPAAHLDMALHALRRRPTSMRSD